MPPQSQSRQPPSLQLSSISDDNACALANPEEEGLAILQHLQLEQQLYRQSQHQRQPEGPTTTATTSPTSTSSSQQSRSSARASASVSTSSARRQHHQLTPRNRTGSAGMAASPPSPLSTANMRTDSREIMLNMESLFLPGQELPQQLPEHQQALMLQQLLMQQQQLIQQLQAQQMSMEQQQERLQEQSRQRRRANVEFHDDFDETEEVDVDDVEDLDDLDVSFFSQHQERAASWNSPTGTSPTSATSGLETPLTPNSMDDDHPDQAGRRNGPHSSSLRLSRNSQHRQSGSQELNVTSSHLRRSEYLRHRRHTPNPQTATVGNVTFLVDALDDVDADDSMLDSEEFLRAKDKQTKVPIWWNIRKTTHRPLHCCGIYMSLWVLCCALLAILAIGFGGLNFDVNVPFYDRSELNQQRRDSYLATKRDADFVATVGVPDGELCVHGAPTVLTRNGTLIQGPVPTPTCQRVATENVRLMYITKDRKSPIMTKENLEGIQAIEARLLNTPDLSKVCHLLYSNYSVFPNRDFTEWQDILEHASAATEQNYMSCERIYSALNFFDPLYFDTTSSNSGRGYYLIPSDVVPQEYHFTPGYIQTVLNYWSDFGWSQTYTSPTDENQEVTLPNLLSKFTTSDFVPGQDNAAGPIGIASMYRLGFPLDGYASSSQSITEQTEKSGQWLWENINPWLKKASFGNVDVYWGDSSYAMAMAEIRHLAIQSTLFFPLSIVFVWLYLTYMQDSFFIGVVGMMQIMLSFIPGFILYRYVFGITYFGVLNVISIYIILGIGVDDIFVFCDQWHHQKNEPHFDQRMQKTYNVAMKAMFATSCTTFISFYSTGYSVFPAISCFGNFAALLVFVNFCAVITFWPSAYAVYYKYVHPKWWDHPFRLLCCNKKPIGRAVDEDSDSDDEGEPGKRKDTFPTSTSSNANLAAVTEEANPLNSHENQIVGGNDDEDDDNETQAEERSEKMVAFLRDKWAPFIVRFRYAVVAFYGAVLVGAVILALQLRPDDEAPNVLPNDNNYVQEIEVLLEYYAGSQNPRAIEVFWVSGINPDTPIDRTGTVWTNLSDIGSANFVDCTYFNPTLEVSQVWMLNTCHDMFFGNVSEYHPSQQDGDSFGNDGSFGPYSRHIVDENVQQDEYNYYQKVSCLVQGLRDWLLTDRGCSALQNYSLPCYNETRIRPNCTTWNTYGNSCEPFPVPPEHQMFLFRDMMMDPTTDTLTMETYYDKYFDQVFVAEERRLTAKDADIILQRDFTCRQVDGYVLFAISNSATLVDDYAQNYEDGIDLYNRWDAWSDQMREHAPREMRGTMQTSNGAWAFYFINAKLMQDSLSNILQSLILSFVVLCVVGGNPIMAFYSAFTIVLIVLDVFAFTVLMGWSFGIIEAVNYVVVIGMSIDYCVHMSEAYTESRAPNRQERVVHMIEEMGISVLSGAVSTLGSCFFMFFAPNSFFVKFAAFIFVTISLSCLYSLTFFPAALAIIGPEGNSGNVTAWVAKKWRAFRHQRAVEYIQTDEFKRRESVRIRKLKGQGVF